VAQLSPIHGLQGTQRGTDLGARQHGTGQLDGDLGLDRQAAAGRPHRSTGSVDGRLGLQQVEDGLDDDQVDAAFDQGGRLLLVGIAQLRVPDLTEGRELRAGPDAPCHPTGSIRCGEVVGSSSSQGCRRQVQLPHTVGLAVLGQHRGERAEGVGLDDVAADFEERSVDAVDGART
jgi:hypothetical protein